MAGAYQICSTACDFLVGSLAFWICKEVSTLKVSNVPARVVTLSCATTLAVPERLQLTPAVL
jgi:hypothetical protein